MRYFACRIPESRPWCACWLAESSPGRWWWPGESWNGSASLRQALHLWRALCRKRHRYTVVGCLGSCCWAQSKDVHSVREHKSQKKSRKPWFTQKQKGMSRLTSAGAGEARSLSWPPAKGARPVPLLVLGAFPSGSSDTSTYQCCAVKKASAGFIVVIWYPVTSPVLLINRL